MTNRAIETLLDLAKKEGSATARGRVRPREEEKAQLEAGLQSLHAQLERARFMVQHLHRPRPRGWRLVLAAIRKTDNLEEKRRCPEVVLRNLGIQKKRGALYLGLAGLGILAPVPPALCTSIVKISNRQEGHGQCDFWPGMVYKYLEKHSEASACLTS